MPGDLRITHRLPAGKGKGTNTGFTDTYSVDVLLSDMAALIKLHLPQIEEFQADEISYDLLRGVMESRYLRQR